VSHVTPQIDDEKYEDRQIELTEEMLKEVTKKFDELPPGDIEFYNSAKVEQEKRDAEAGRM